MAFQTIVSWRLLLFGIGLAFLMSGCRAGLHMNISDHGTAGAGAPSSPFAPMISTASTGGGLVESPNLIVYVRTSATSFKGNIEGDHLRMTDPFMESGIGQVLERVMEE